MPDFLDAELRCQRRTFLGMGSLALGSLALPPLIPAKARAAGVVPSRSQGMMLNDPLVPVVADGIGLGIAQAQSAAHQRAFILTGNPRGVIGVLGGDLLSSYAPGPMIKASVEIFMPGWGAWGPNTAGATTADDDHVYGQPGVAAWSTRLGFNSGNARRRFTQRWYKIPGVPDTLFLEVLFTVDKSSTDGAATTVPTAASDVGPYTPRFDLMFESKPWASGGGITLQYDPALDGIPFINNSPNTNGSDPLWYFVRCLNEQSSGYYYDDAAAVDRDQNFGSGALPAGAAYTTVGDRTFRAHLSVTPDQGLQLVYCLRFVVGLGHTLKAAKNATRGVPNQGPEKTIAQYEAQVAAMPAPAALSSDEAKAWGYFVLNPIINTRTERDWQPERPAWDGVHRRLPFNALGRWNALWVFDTAIGLCGMSQVDPELVRSCLDYFINGCMNQATGFLRRDPTTTIETSIGNFYLARTARRYLAATGDGAFLTGLYPKLKLLYNWWTTTAPGVYRHPNWPRVKLLTSSTQHEVQEASPVTAGGNFPSGDDWLTAIAYDHCVHMAYLASVTSNKGDVAFWDDEAAAYKDALRTHCWDPGQGWFQPVMKASSPSGGKPDHLGRFQAVRTYRGFWHLWAGVATPAQAKVMRDQIMDPNIFLGAYGVRTVDKRWTGYLPGDWVNGGSRPYFDAAVSLGLRRYGYGADADLVLQRWIDRQNVVGTTPEMTNPDTGTGGFARFLLTGVMLIEAMLAKRAPDMLGVDSGATLAIGVGPVTS